MRTPIVTPITECNHYIKLFLLTIRREKGRVFGVGGSYINICLTPKIKLRFKLLLCTNISQLEPHIFHQIGQVTPQHVLGDRCGERPHGRMNGLAPHMGFSMRWNLSLSSSATYMSWSSRRHHRMVTDGLY